MAPTGTEQPRPAPFSHEWIAEIVAHHAPNDEELARIAKIRYATASFVSLLADLCPDCEDRKIAAAHARDAMMHATASIALRGLV